ncbi:MAG: ABC transporter permease, partial [Gemmatimonadota bacterium]
MRHLRQVVRGLQRRPAFTLVVVLTLALGIGANSAIFTVVRAVLLKPLPYQAPESLTLLWSRWTNFDKTWISPAEFTDYERMDHLFESAAAWAENDEVAITGNAKVPESVVGALMTYNMLDVLGLKPLLGRAFTREEDVPNGPSVVMLGNSLWQRRYAGDRSLVGKTIEVNGQAATVVGILPAEFKLPLEFQRRTTAQIITPLAFDRAAPNRGNHGMHGIARMKAGVSVALVNSELTNLTKRWTTEGLYPEAMRFSAFAVPVIEEVSGGVSMALKVLAAAVGFLLLLTCANVANLVLTRADGRSREVAVRSALGADRGDILRLTLIESAVLSIAGGAVGLALAWAGVKVLVAAAPTSIPRLSEVSVDGFVVLFALLLSAGTAVLFGVIPAVRGAAMDLSGGLREGTRGQSGGIERRRARTALVVAEMALAVLLVIGAGLTIRSFANLQAITPGFDPTNVLTLRMSLPASRHPSNESVVNFYQSLGDEVRQMSGVQAAGFVRLLPLATEIGDSGLEIEGKPLPAGTPNRSADWQAATPGYFEAMGIRAVKGRLFDRRETPDGLPVILINETLAREYFPNEDPVGQRIRVGGQQRPWRSIVGVVADVHHNGLLNPVKRAYFIPHNQWHVSFGNTRRAMTLAVRSTNDPRDLLGPITSAVRRRDADLPLTQITLMDDVLGDALREQRFTMALMTGFAVFALILAAIGI